MVVVHNGIIENYLALKDRLTAEGHRFVTETDTEVVAHLIEAHLGEGILRAVQAAVKELRGAYAGAAEITPTLAKQLIGLELAFAARLFGVVERYPELEGNEVMEKLRRELVRLDEDLVPEGELDTRFVRLGGWVELPVRMFFRAEIEYNTGDDLEGSRFNVGLGYRF